VSVLTSSSSTNNTVQLDVPLSDPALASIQPDIADVLWFIPTLSHGSSSGDIRDVTTNGASTTYSTNFAALASTVAVLGFCTVENTSQDLYGYYLTKDTTAKTATLYQVYTPHSTGSPGAPTTPISGVSYSGSSGWMAVDPSGLASGATGTVVYVTHAPDNTGKYTTDMIDSTRLMTSWSGRDHVAGFLSTGRLLTREGSFYNVCDPNGKTLYSFPAGTLRFDGEYVDVNTSTMRVRFTEALLEQPQNGGQDKVRLRSYSIATSKLDSLQ
jgi:hypothetical protein